MAIYPGGAWRPVPWANARDDSTPATIVVLHVTASTAASQWSFFNSSRSACSNFHVALDGDVEQYIDSDHISAADVEGSNDAISIETAGLGSGEWTAAQMTALAKLLAWINRTHGIPLVLKTTSSPSERGIGWHRLGIIGNFPSLPSLLAGRNQRGYAGESWSGSTGKVCPGDKRILQIPTLVKNAIQINSPEEPDMDANDKKTAADTLAALKRVEAKLDEVHAGTAPKIDKTAAMGGEKITLRTAIKETRLAVTGELARVVTAAVTKAVKDIPGVDAKVVEAATEKAVRDALSDGVTLIKE